MLIGEKIQQKENCYDVVPIKYDELPIDLQCLSDYIGIENIPNVLKNIQGQQIYFPKTSNLKKYVKRYIKERNIISNKVLAMELHCSENFIAKMKLEMIIEEMK